MQEAQTFAIRLSAHHKPHVNMGKLRLVGQPQYYMFARFLGGDLVLFNDESHCFNKPNNKKKRYLRILSFLDSYMK